MWKKRILLQAEYDLLMNERAIDMHMKSRQQYHGERASKMLSHQLKQMEAANYTSAVWDKDSNAIRDQLG